MQNDRIFATYYVETPCALEEAAEVLASEQSTGTFVRLPGETDELRERFAARVEKVTPLEIVDAPAFPGSKPLKAPPGPVRYHRGELQISFSMESSGPKLTSVLSAVAGGLFELRTFSGIRLIDIELPQAFTEAYPGPQFGIQGTRELTGVHEGPIIGTITKPSVGLTPEDTAELVRKLAAADVDFIKDDEIMANPPYSPLEKRVDAVMRVINNHADRTGKKVMYAFHISDDLEEMLRHHDTVQKAGGTCVMVSVNTAGITGLSYLRKRCALPIHAHRNGWGMITRHPLLGMSFPVFQKIWRTVGVDHIHTNGLGNKFWETDDSVVESIQACLSPFLGGYYVMPVVSSGQWGGQAPETYRRIQSNDLMYVAGGGIMAHPGGPGAGVIAIRQAWEAARKGIPLDDYAKEHVELRQSLEKFGNKK